ncbi:MAG: response regulator, partial [Chloroflexia bacterium]|nr:response regulator [Chloroflexia bacterium]
MKKLKNLNCILLVDDEEVNNYYIRLLIEKMELDVHVESVLNGKAAIDYLTGTGKYASNQTFLQPDLIFLDINMPLMDGWEFLEEYATRKLQNEKKRVITMLTSSNNPDDEEKASHIED